MERFDQFHDGVPIWGADIVRDSERGVAVSVFGELAPTNLQVRTQPTLSVSQAHEAMTRLAGRDSLLLGGVTLVILPTPADGYKLAYSAVVAAQTEFVRLFIDAHSGSELLRFSAVHTQQAAVGTGNGVLGDRKKLSVETSGGGYIAFDRHRPPIIQTFDMRGDLNLTKLLLLRRLPYTASDLARDSDNVWTDVAVVDAHAHVSWTYDYYFKRFGRSGLDGRNGPISIVVNPVHQRDGLLVSAADRGTFVANAGVVSGGGPNGTDVIFFGNGILPGADFGNGRNYTYFAGALDIAAHELTHAVINSTSQLEYLNESGALNEALADMMGKGAEFFYRQAGAGPGQADYVIGKDISRSVRAGIPNGDRSMANPTLYNQPEHYSGYRRLPATSDNGGVHTNSGIPNHVFYLAIEGGTHRTSGVTVQGVGPANREQIERVFYRALTTLTPRSANFSTARIISIQAARDLYGAGGAVERAVTQAWDAVGVTNTSSFAPTITRLPTITGTIPADDGRTFFYTIVNMTTTGRYQAVLNWNDSSVDLDLMIGPPGCFSHTCMITRAESPTRRPETVCATVRAGEQYYVSIQNFSPRSATVQLTQTIDPSPTGPCTLPGPSAISSTPETNAAKHGRDVGVRAVPFN